MTKKKPKKVNRAKRAGLRSSSDSNGAATSVGENVRSLLSPEFSAAFDNLVKGPSIHTFLHALGMCGNPVETAKLCGQAGSVAKTLGLTNGRSGPHPALGDPWSDAWQLAKIFSLVEALDGDVLLAPDDSSDLAPVDMSAEVLQIREELKRIEKEFRVAAAAGVDRDLLWKQKGMLSPYARLAEWKDVFVAMEPYLECSPLTDLDKELSEYLATHARDEDLNHPIGGTRTPLAVGMRQREQLAELWDAACLQLMVSQPPKGSAAAWPIRVSPVDYAFQLQALFPLALSGVGNLLLCGDVTSSDNERSEHRASNDRCDAVSELSKNTQAIDGDELAHQLEETFKLSHERDDAEPLLALLTWIRSAAKFSPLMRKHVRKRGDPSEVLINALGHAPLLPPALVEALVKPAVSLNNWYDFDDTDTLNTARCIGIAMTVGDPDVLASKDGYAFGTILTERESQFLSGLCGMAAKLPLDLIGYMASQFQCRHGFPVQWPGDASADAVQIGNLFRLFQRQLVILEGSLGSKLVVDAEYLQFAFSVAELPDDTSAISVRWAIQQVLCDDVDAEPDSHRVRARNFGLLTSLLLDRGLASLAGAFHAFFIVSQCILVLRVLVAQQQGGSGFAAGAIYVDDWARFSSNTSQLTKGKWASKVEACARYTMELLSDPAWEDRFAFEARQVMAHFPGSADQPELERLPAEVLKFGLDLPASTSIRTRLQGALGGEFDTFPDWIQQAMISAERLFEVSVADRGVVSTHRSNPWVIEYAKLIERTLQQALGIMWTNPSVRQQADALFRETNSSRRFPGRFEVGAALAILGNARKQRTSELRDRLVAQGLDFEALSGELGNEIRVRVSQVRNQEAHSTASDEDARALRVWVLGHFTRIYGALGRPT
jgi:hypothetical protein